MIPILTTAQVREADAWTIAHGKVTSSELMERAARACSNLILERSRGLLNADRPVHVLCGMGNNGGDGLAIARHLKEHGAQVVAALVHHRTEASNDNTSNQERFAAIGGTRIDIRSKEDLEQMKARELIIDALVGTGLARPLEGLLADAVQWIDAQQAIVVSIDLPSGLNGDSLPDPRSPIVHADHTFGFQVPRPVFFHPGSAPFLGDWTVLPIGLDAGHIAEMKVRDHLIEERDLVSLLPMRPRFAHKGTFGHALLVAGGRGRAGAAVLAARACVRSGAGLCTAHVPADALAILQISVPEAMCHADPHADHISQPPPLEQAQAVGVGPGIGTHDDTARMLKRLIQEIASPLVIDADGLNILSENKTWLGFLPANTVLTPHPKEFDRLAGPSANSMERLQRARDMAVKWRCVIVMKGAFTAVCDPLGNVHFNPTGNPGMAKGGSGDALTGLITGLLAQGVPVVGAALLGTFVHGLAGDHAAAAIGTDGMNTGDLVAHLPAAFRQLRARG